MNPLVLGAVGIAALLLFLNKGGQLPTAPTSDATVPLTSSSGGDSGASVTTPPDNSGGSSQGTADTSSGGDYQSSLVSTYTAEPAGSGFASTSNSAPQSYASELSGGQTVSDLPSNLQFQAPGNVYAIGGPSQVAAPVFAATPSLTGTSGGTGLSGQGTKLVAS